MCCTCGERQRKGDVIVGWREGCITGGGEMNLGERERTGKEKEGSRIAADDRKKEKRKQF